MQRVSRRTLLKRTMVAAGSMVGLGMSASVYATAVEPGWLDLVQVSLPLPRLDPVFNDYRVVHISDIHLDEWMTSDRLAHVVNIVNQQQPDLVALTGDFVTHAPAQYLPDLAAGLSALTAHDAVVAVLGNHDHWTDPFMVREALHNGGVRELPNAVHTIKRNGAVLHIAGVDDITVGKDRLATVLAQLPTAGAALLLAHEPDFADTSAATGRFDLQLSGHSHGGQVRVPLLGAPLLPPLGQKYSMGLYQVGTMLQYTTRGVGMTAPHVRFHCRPEVTLLTLLAHPA